MTAAPAAPDRSIPATANEHPILARWFEALPWTLEVARYKQIPATRRRTPREHVAEFEEVWPGPRHFRTAIVVDVDDVPEAGAAWIDAGLPQPTFIIWSSFTNCHLVWRLEQWVDDRKRRKLCWFRTVQRAYTEACRGGDLSYSSASHHNPLHPRFVTVVGPRDNYNLTELAQGVDIPSRAPVWAKTSAPDREIGPNCDVFNRSRRRIYGAVESYRQRRDRHGFKEFVRTIIATEASEYEQRHARHVRGVHVKSVAKSTEAWSWDCYKRGSEPIEARRARYKRSRHEYLSEVAEMRLKARRRRDAGDTLRKIATALGVSKSSVCNYLRATAAQCPRSATSEIAPVRAREGTARPRSVGSQLCSLAIEQPRAEQFVEVFGQQRGANHYQARPPP